jgi:cystathionine gamma-synthase
VNCRPIEHGADFVIHSTTKFLNGGNDHGGGAIIVRDRKAAAALARFRERWHDDMSAVEAVALEARLGTFPVRMKRFNENAAVVAAFLAKDESVGRLYFNGSPTHRSFATAQRILDGTGSVMSFTLADESWEALQRFYDSPLTGIVKAPSLGSDATLLCPYGLLTHLDDSDEELAAIGLPRFLLRLAIGCEEDMTPLLDSLRAALENLRKG